jgi:hypothetical protein
VPQPVTGRVLGTGTGAGAGAMEDVGPGEDDVGPGAGEDDVGVGVGV